VSEAYLRRVFLRIYGRSPLEYINGLRIERAKEMLLSGLYSIGDIAFNCGFSDAKYFSTAFKRITGRTPSDYAKK
jgi:AraC family transcriptional regulator